MWFTMLSPAKVKVQSPHPLGIYVQDGLHNESYTHTHTHQIRELSKRDVQSQAWGEAKGKQAGEAAS